MSGTKSGKFINLAKRVRMGKKIEKALGKDKNSIQGSVDDADKPPEPYVCKGHFVDDFTELCKRNNMERIPPVILRPKRPPSPNSAPPPEEKHKGSKKDTKRAQQEAQMLETEPEPEVDEFGDPLPKTFLVKNKFEYFKPCIQTEMDHPDKQDTVTSIFIRGWKLDVEMLRILKECWMKLEKLHTINLWNSGLNGQTVETLASFLLDCTNIKILILDNNPVKEQNYDLLLREESNIQQLSLRHCSINDKGAENLAKSLGSLHKTNNKLVSLNLNGNFITDQGASSLARALRLNRCLLSLSLAYNQIGDHGATAFANVISKFELTHEEIVERRKLQSEKSESPVDYRRSPMPNGRRGESRDRPGSVRSQINIDKGDKKKQGGSKGKKEKEKEDDKGKSKGKKDEKTKKAIEKGEISVNF
ncbi:DgyrCDS3414 [Dimorphilus gyrociliatus]|uniref:DgyrCDS3414 n=1 Tax=Dimorphilus gyrociliatus TaxID=2664684 RepID=A0A7I8VD47_9ANNE|nr:DgyrCDS3414 [Dimorphilus gyrociliatus]